MRALDHHSPVAGEGACRSQGRALADIGEVDRDGGDCN
jgi:hypothetical protein